MSEDDNRDVGAINAREPARKNIAAGSIAHRYRYRYRYINRVHFALYIGNVYIMVQWQTWMQPSITTMYTVLYASLSIMLFCIWHGQSRSFVQL